MSWSAAASKVLLPFCRLPAHRVEPRRLAWFRARQPRTQPRRRSPGPAARPASSAGGAHRSDASLRSHQPVALCAGYSWELGPRGARPQVGSGSPHSDGLRRQLAKAALYQVGRGSRRRSSRRRSLRRRSSRRSSSRHSSSHLKQLAQQVGGPHVGSGRSESRQACVTGSVTAAGDDGGPTLHQGALHGGSLKQFHASARPAGA